jgi:hypothetical protein
VEKNMVATKRSSSHDVHLNPKHKGGAAAAGGSGIASERRESAAAVALIEPLGGFIFVCNNDTMSEDFERHLFGKVLSLSPSLSLSHLLLSLSLFLQFRSVLLSSQLLSVLLPGFVWYLCWIQL